MTRAGSRSRSLSTFNWTCKPFAFPPTQPWEHRIGATQGHTNQVIDSRSLHHVLTFEESQCLGWIFHVTTAHNRQSISTRGLLRDPAQNQGGRDSVHFMYHNDNPAGYIRMAEGTTVPRQYRDQIYCVLLPRTALQFELFLSKNGVVLIYDDVPAEFIRIVDQLPTIASNVLRPGRGHTLSSTVTGGTWPDDITYERVVQEKGVGSKPGQEIPDEIRTMAWSFMGQATPTNYCNFFFWIAFVYT